MFALLGQAIYDDNSPQELSRLKDDITNEFLLCLKNTHPIEGSIDAWVDGDINVFAERATEIPLFDSLEESFPGIRSYMYYHILEGVEDWDDIGYARWVAEGFIRHFGHGEQPPPLEVPSMFDSAMSGLIDLTGYDSPPPPLIAEDDLYEAMG